MIVGIGLTLIALLQFAQWNRAHSLVISLHTDYAKNQKDDTSRIRTYAGEAQLISNQSP